MDKEEKGTILVVEDDLDFARLLENRLIREGYRCVEARDGLEALMKVKTTLPDIILLDVMLPLIDGPGVKRKLNEAGDFAAIPVIFLTSQAATEDKVKGLGLGAVDYVCKPPDFPELLARVEGSIRRKKSLEKMASTDPFTGLQNRSSFKKQLNFLCEIARRYQRPFSLAVIDVDHLKLVNDRYGHAAGDQVITSVAEVMKKVFRKADFLIRYGGDEFVVLLPETALAQAEKSLERFRKALSAEVIELPSADAPLRCTVSIGLAAYEEGTGSPEELFERSDRKMYQEKHSKPQLALD